MCKVSLKDPGPWPIAERVISRNNDTGQEEAQFIKQIAVIVEEDAADTGVIQTFYM